MKKQLKNVLFLFIMCVGLPFVLFASAIIGAVTAMYTTTGKWIQHLGDEE